MILKNPAHNKSSSEGACPSRVLLIGGWVGEPVAGLQVDQQIFAELGIPTLSIITELTSQGFAAVGSSYPVNPEYFRDMLQQAGSAPWVKIGLLRDPEQMGMLSTWLKQTQARIILDPILESSRGLRFHSESSRKCLREVLLPHCDLITPNVAELCWLVGRPLNSFRAYIDGARELLALGVKNVLITGLQDHHDSQATDVFISEHASLRLSTPYWPVSMRGSGCRLASYITAACFQKKGEDSNPENHSVNLWEEAVIQGKTWMARDFRRLAQPACTIKEPSYLDFPKATEIDSESPIPASQDHCQPELVPVFQARDHLVRVNGLYVIADSAEKLRISFAAGARLGQLRCKSLGHDQLREEATKAMAWAKEYKATFILNDDLELAEAIGAWGVHLGQEDLQRYGRQRLMQRKVALGISTHSLKELALALDYLPDYVALGPIFPTTCKSMAFGPQGLEKVGPWAQFSGLPLVAIGGMTPETGIQAKNLGAASIAVLSDLFHHPQGIILRVEEWLRALGEC